MLLDGHRRGREPIGFRLVDLPIRGCSFTLLNGQRMSRIDPFFEGCPVTSSSPSV
ncbi:hypothetical protein CsSME_00045966 [Camellia sinensis var. sinensis]